MKIRTVCLIMLLGILKCFSNDNYGIDYYLFEEQPNFRFAKNYYYLQTNQFNIGLVFIPFELGTYELEFVRFEPGNEQFYSVTQFYNSAGIGPVVEYICYDNLYLKLEYNILVNVDGLYGFIYHRFENRIAYSIWREFQIGLSINYKSIQNNLREKSQYTRQTYEGINNMNIGLSIEKSFKETVLTNVFDGFLYVVTGIRFLIAPLKGP